MSLKELKDTPPWDWPEGTGELLLGILRDDRTREADLVVAAELAGDITVVDERLVETLLFLVSRGDKSDQVRGTAAISLGAVLEYSNTEDEGTFDGPISEVVFRELQKLLHKLYLDTAVPDEVRRRILEASVRASSDWHEDAVRAAFSSDDESWKLTAVFCMRYVRGFKKEILNALRSGNPDIRLEAIVAAGNQEVDAAWPHIAALVTKKTAKPLLLAAIDAVACIRPKEALPLLDELADSEDEDVVLAVEEARAMARGLAGGDEDEPDEDDEQLH